jgi:hypothetical protein
LPYMRNIMTSWPGCIVGAALQLLLLLLCQLL